jgi:sedoheptulose-bisphosphatase
VFLCRHGETEWSLNGRHTGRTDIPLTPNGIRRMRLAAKALVGDDRLITPSTITQIFVSPRKRAHQTLEILSLPPHIPVKETPALQEWDYGDYEGITTASIRASRPDGTWDIWRDGCPGGEDPEDIAKRCDALIGEIREIHRRATETETDGDVLCVAHAHILRSFTARWLGLGVAGGRHFLLDAGGAGVLWFVLIFQAAD